MKEIDFSLDGVFDALNAQPARGAGPGRCVMFVAARRGEGVTTIAKAAAEAAGPGTVYAIDLDLRRNALAKALKAKGAALGPRIDGRLSGQSFYQLADAHGRAVAEPLPAFSYHRISRGRLYAGVFDQKRMPDGGRILISSAPDYWNAARAGGAVVVVDAPALQRSQIGLRCCAHMDGVVLVVGADAGAAPGAMAAKTDLMAAGANVIGIVYAKADAPVVTMDRLLRRAS